jgi:phosphomannomutase/phosphoglucomutase
MSPEPRIETGSVLLNPTGFREYDARWLFETDIDLAGMRRVGEAFGTLIRDRCTRPHVVSGHDYRSYSESLKAALIDGMVEAGCIVHDIGLSVTPMAYFAQFALDVSAVAMVTASHNENGWTGVKMGLERPFTLGPDEMGVLKVIALENRGVRRAGGRCISAVGMKERYLNDLTSRPKLSCNPRVVVACGNGTAGAFAPETLERIGCSIIPLHCDLNFDFPNYNPNPEDLTMLADVSQTVIAEKADFGLAFDGDGDRCGVVDNKGRAIYADKIGLLIAREIAARRPNARFIADVKSTGLFLRDTVLRKRGGNAELWRTGHSYMKRRLAEVNADAAFEKSGHYFFGPPFGRGYDDGLVSAVAICELLERTGKQLAELYHALPLTWSSPTISIPCSDDRKYGLVDGVRKSLEVGHAKEQNFSGRRIVDVHTINGVRIELEDGSWGLVRASSNKPEIVIVCESVVSEGDMQNLIDDLQKLVA